MYLINGGSDKGGSENYGDVIDFGVMKLALRLAKPEKRTALLQSVRYKCYLVFCYASQLCNRQFSFNLLVNCSKLSVRVALKVLVNKITRVYKLL